MRRTLVLILGIAVLAIGAAACGGGAALALDANNLITAQRYNLQQSITAAVRAAGSLDQTKIRAELDRQTVAGRFKLDASGRQAGFRDVPDAVAGRDAEARVAHSGRRGAATLAELKRHRRTILLALAGLAIGWLVAASLLFVWPPSVAPEHADAIVVLAGGRGPRLAEGLKLARAGVAPVLVVSDGWSPTWPEANRLCAGRAAPVEVVCFHPDPYDTHGEAKTFSRLAARRGWDSVVVVSSRYHVVRARMLFERCFAGAVSTASSGESLVDRVLAAPIETLKMGYALVDRRSC